VFHIDIESCKTGGCDIDGAVGSLSARRQEASENRLKRAISPGSEGAMTATPRRSGG